MKYVGKLFGQIGRTRGYFDTGKTSGDWDALEARAERAEAELGKLQELHGCSQEMVLHWCEHAANRSLGLDQARAELATERARLDYMNTRGFEHRHHETGDHLSYEWTISSTNELKDVGLREVIDAAMKEGAK
jgi:hypothetical protein